MIEPQNIVNKTPREVICIGPDFLCVFVFLLQVYSNLHITEICNLNLCHPQSTPKAQQ